ncbi:LPXTG-site transpeptidase (sortase) family protein, partial [Pilibacter termitis]
TPPGINTYRLLVNGHRIPYAKAEKMPINKRNFWSYQSIVLSSLLFCFVVFMILYLLHRYFMKKSKSEDETIRNKAKKRMKHLIYVTRALFVTLLVTMIGVLVVAIYGYLLMKQNTELPPVQVGETSQLASYTPDKILNGDYEGKEIASVNIANYAEAKKNMQKNVNDWGVGKLYIPSQEINLPILAGLKNENLLNGASTFRQDQKLGLDNYVLLAHNIYETDVLFNRISELKKGEEIYATDFQDIYIYKVFENKVVRDTEVDVVERRKEGESPIITLIRCEGNIGTIYRRIVQGEFVKTIPLSEAKQTSKPLLQEMKLEMSGTPKNGIYLKDPPISVFHLFCMNLAANILADPMQVLIPLVLLLVLPILFLAII